MNVKTWVPLGAALLLGLIAAVVARNSLMRTRGATPQVKTISIVVAKGYVAPGQALTAEQLTLAPIIAKVPPPDTFSNVSDLEGRVTVVPLVAGQFVLQNFLAPRGTPSGLQALIPRGMRAVTVDVNESSGLAGLLAPGCHVDVVSTSVSKEDPDRTLSRIIVQDIPVLAVGQRMSGPRPEGEKETAMSRTVTLLASPHDAEALDLALVSSRLRLVLRGTGDTRETDDEGVMVSELRGGSAASVAMAVAPFLKNLFARPEPPLIPQPVPPPATQPTVVKTEEPQPKKWVMTIIQGKEERQYIFHDDHLGPEARPATVTDNSEGQKPAVPQ